MGFGISFLWIDLHLPFFFFSVNLFLQLILTCFDKKEAMP
ncbi:hypothetical protein PORCAN_793 [Porphyromonas crevioricanis JCM 13913]|nr:hypothetical protein PORCAN_793 [Porphyromonas crevioricanis JCM 13913]